LAGTFDRLGDILRDRLDNDEDPFENAGSETGKPRSAGNVKTRIPPPRSAKRPELVRVPDGLVRDFMVLGLPPGSSESACKKAWKKLLMTHHPDMHAENPADQEKSTKLSTEINASYRRICHWFSTGSVI
jgi:hypothetical protein